MFSHSDMMMVIGVLLSIGFIVALILFMNAKVLVGIDEKNFLTRYVSLLLTALVGLFIADKLIAFNVQLLAPEISKELFDLIKNIVLMTFSYQFGVNSKENKA